MIGLEQNCDDSWSLDNPARRLMRIEIRYAVPEATLRGMAFLQVCLALLVERFRPRQHWNLNAAGAEVLKKFRVSRLPDSGQIRFPIRHPRRRRRQVRFAIRRSRNPGGWVV